MGNSSTTLEPLLVLEAVDIVALVFYFALAIGAGFVLRRVASKGIENYFLGGRKIPWWVLGASGTASNFDMTGTMIIVSFVFAIGMQGFWVSMRGGMCLPLGMLMIYMGRWLRRSDVMTTAEWMELRFGKDRQGQAARLLSASANIIVTVAMLTYFVTGTGKFLSMFLPWPPLVCAALMIGIGLLYTVMSGLYGVAFTDIIQELFIIVTALYVGYEATMLPNHADVIASGGEAWSSFVPRWEATPMAWLANPEVYQLFGLTIVFWMAKGLLEGAGGIFGGYMPQRYYAAGSDRDAALMTAEWILLLMFRWILIAGAAVLALSLAQSEPTVGAYLQKDPEKALPTVLGKLVPAGLRGIAVSGLIAAAMSTFDSTANAGAAYWVRDIYQRHLNPKATQKQLLRQSYGATMALAAIALVLGAFVKNIDDIWSWITGPLFAGLFAPIVLRWYWSRLNGYGFAYSTAGGLVFAVMLRLAAPNLPLFITFPIVWTVSLTTAIFASLLTQPTPGEVLEAFWLKVRPFGLWRSVRKNLDGTLVKKEKTISTRDLSNVPLAVMWHLSSVVAVVSVVLHKWSTAASFASVFACLTVVLYFRWYKKL